MGGGESSLVDDLLDTGYRNITVLDISATALDVARNRLGARASRVTWIAGDVTRQSLPDASYDVWHDRAVFHFLTRPDSRAAYVERAVRALKPGGHVVMATFGPHGPLKCSGLEIVRYDAAALHREMGSAFRLVDRSTELHHTPFGTAQEFLYCVFQLKPLST